MSDPQAPSATSSADHVKTLDEAELTPTREVAALHRFEAFLFSAIATVLCVRAFLALTGYPKVGGGGLHVAHVLWGGLLMAIAVVCGLAGLGSRVRTLSAITGGIGFGLFIDEIGKFLTTNVNYFYTPAVAIMYIVFVSFYLIGRQLILRRRLTDRRRLALVTVALGDQALGQLDHRNQQVALSLLDGIEHPNAGSDALRRALLEMPLARRRFQVWLDGVQARLVGILQTIVVQPLMQLLIFGFLSYEVVRKLKDYLDYLRITIDIERLETKVNNLDPSAPKLPGFSFYFWYLLLSNLFCAALAAVGLLLLVFLRTRRWGLRVVALALLLDILFDQFSAFHYSQFAALIGFSVELVVLIAVRYLLRTKQIPVFNRGLIHRRQPRPA